MSKNSLFIVIEGLDGSGKTTAAKRLTEVLNAHLKDKVKLTFEPHDASAAGLFIRQVLTKKIENFDHHVLALGYAANRLDHCSRIIRPWLKKENGIVISDRYYLSSLVYQSRPDFSFEEVMKLNNKAVKPDLIFFMNVSNEVCYERMNIRNQPRELFEGNLTETRQKYFNAIKFLKEKHDDLIVEIDAGGTIEENVLSLLKALQKHFPDFNFPTDFDFETNENSYENLDFDWEKLKSNIETNEPQLTDFQNIISNLSLTEKGSLFLNYLENLNYKIGKKMLLPNVTAFELNYTLPGNISLRGAALLLPKPQQLGSILKTVPALSELSDFVFVFSPGDSDLATRHYERDIIEFKNSKNETAKNLFPSVRMITEKDLSEFIQNIISK